ncbi:M20/M25/M40 family metallo-hydrolase [Legionella maioricensis]|uniref:M20/M25/M40 family metallo-hydrolase n=1 Tax=Legionella maioricensis TaxID=2896528 RepID=A0A9X2IBG7_9GAMM|nr:M20/M25/M40 family metallo-hydrolase [Legionella maioricensis]MCL9683377.1 M20/M25/M40 family metallo-hydrolase [Legionella maioricensis]MCL9685927.1 M20/M25/M40 family metallo-hydrolase [Legionella maioricensis]
MISKKITQISCSIVLALLTGATEANTTRPVDEQQRARAIYKQFIEVQSGFTTGSTTPLVEIAVKRLKEAGFSDKDIFVGGASPQKANLVVRYRGTGEQKPLLLLAHTDVVEAKPSDWSMNPFQLTEKEGYFYGRGSLDDKAQAAIWIANLIQYKHEGFKPKRDIIVALTADEEGSSPYNGVRWLIKNQRNLIEADFALNEGGWGDLTNGKKISQNIQVSEKYIINYTLEVRNKGGHSSLPTNDNAIYRLAEALERLAKFNFPLKTNEVTTAYFKQMAAIETGPLKTEMIEASKGSQPAMNRLAAHSPQWNALLRTTCTPTLLEGGHAMNALPQLAAVTINCRVLPEDSPEMVEQSLKQAINDPQVALKRIGKLSRGPSSPLSPEILKTMAQLTQTYWPSVPTIPIMVTGATDGRYLRAIGIPTYGVMGLFLDRNDFRAHGRDERISIESFYESQAFLYDLVKQLSNNVA